MRKFYKKGTHTQDADRYSRIFIFSNKQSKYLRLSNIPQLYLSDHLVTCCSGASLRIPDEYLLLLNWIYYVRYCDVSSLKFLKNTELVLFNLTQSNTLQPKNCNRVCSYQFCIFMSHKKLFVYNQFVICNFFVMTMIVSNVMQIFSVLVNIIVFRAHK